MGEDKAALAWIDVRTSPLDKAWSLWGLAEGLAGRLPAPPPCAIPADDDALGPLNRPTATTPAAPTLKPITSFRGKIMLFGTMRLGDREGRRIEMINPDGTGLETVLTLDEGEQIHAGRISADGEHLAFCASQPWKENPRLVAADDGSRPPEDRRSTSSSSPGRPTAGALPRSATRTREHRVGKTSIIDVKTGHEQRLPIPKEDAVDDWSPDGKTLAVMAGNVDKAFEHPTKGNVSAPADLPYKPRRDRVVRR